MKNEFKLHKNSKDAQLLQFQREWNSYLDDLRTRRDRFGKDLDPQAERVLSEDQKQKLKDLKDEVRLSALETK